MQGTATEHQTPLPEVREAELGQISGQEVALLTASAPGTPVHTPQHAGFEQPPIPEEIVRLRAYQLYLARGANRGDAVSDWLQAEGELRRASPGQLT